MRAIVTETVDAHRLRKMRDLLAFEKLTTWRRMNGFDRVADDENNWSHGLPSTPEEYTASLTSDLQELKSKISMPAKTRPWQKTMDFVDGLKGKLPDEELAVVKRYVEKKSREAAQAQVTVTQVDTVQYCSPSPQTREPSPDVCMSLESNEGKMDSELKELEPPSAGTGPETPGQQCPPNEGTFKKGRTIADGYSLVAMGSNQGGNIFHLRWKAWTREPSELRQTSLSCSRATSPKAKIKAAERTSSSTPVEKERRHHFGTRL